MSQKYERKENWYKVGAYPMRRCRTRKQTAYSTATNATVTLLKTYEQIVEVHIFRSINCTAVCQRATAIVTDGLLRASTLNPVGKIIAARVDFDPVSHREVREKEQVKEVLVGWQQIGSHIVFGDVG